VKKALPWVVSTAAFLLLVVVGWLAGTLIGLSGTDLLVLRASFALLGLVAGVLTYLLMRARARRRAADGADARGPTEDIDVAIAAAQARLAASTTARGARIGAQPLVLVLGPPGSTKTTVVVRSGLEPELLAGEVFRGDLIAPTDSVNVWFAQDTIFLEAGGKVVADPPRWIRLIRHIQPKRLAAAFSGGAQAPRVAVVCFGCDELLKPGSTESVPAAANKLRARLAELSRHLGIRLPVYVLFTKADRIPYFDDYVRSFTREEANDVLGATLPALPTIPAGTYADRESARISAAFREIFQSLALRRPDVLSRETQEEVRAAAYEFPREFRKITDLATRFLVELCKPSQLSVSPFLRGFYFTGVRAVLVPDSPAAAPAPKQAVGPAGLDATSVFDARAIREAAAQARPSDHGMRKIPEWVFLKRVFQDVILRDEAAMGVTRGGTRVNLLRRVAIGSAAALFLILAAGFTTSFFSNRALTRDALAAVRGVEGARQDGDGLPSLDALQRLDALRAQLVRLNELDRGDRPWRYRWWLFRGDAIRSELRRAYFARFLELMWADGRNDLVADLAGLPEAPGETSEYGATYDALKAYLITTGHPDRSTPEFLAPVLLSHWRAGRALDDERRELAARQFEFYALELPYGNPYGEPANEALVARARAFLNRFANTERLYQALIAEATAANPPIEFRREFPGSEAAVRNRFTVPGAFTKAGWSTVQERLDNVDRLLDHEAWVIGERAVSSGDRARLAQELRERYVREYVAHWRDFLAAGSLVPFGSVDQAARTLARIADNQSPLLQLLALASRNTDVDTSAVARAFQPVHQVTPPEVTDRLVSDANSAYISALMGLQASLDQVATAAGPARAQAVSQAAASADQAKQAVRELALGFSIEGEARRVGQAVRQLLESPITGAEALLGRLPAADVNAAGASFCQPFRELAARYPFNPTATVEASIDDVVAVFQPGGSALWSFYDDVLRELLVRQGNRYAAKVGATPQPTAAFVAFFNRAADISRAFFNDRGEGPEVAFVLRPQTTDAVPEVTITVDGQTQTVTRTVSATRTFVWQGARARVARLSARIGDREVTLIEPPPGPWALFRMIQQAEAQEIGGGRYMLRWRFDEHAIVLAAELNVASGVPIFLTNVIGQLNCVPQIAR